MAEARHSALVDNTNDNDALTDQSVEEIDHRHEEKTDDGDEEVEEYYSESDEDEAEDNLTLSEQLDIERNNFREAKRRIGNLITQVTEYQQEMDQNRQELEMKIRAVTVEHEIYEETLQEEIDDHLKEIDLLQAANRNLKTKHANDLQTILIEMKELEQKNAEYQKQISESRQANKAKRESTNGQRGIAEISLDNEQLDKMLSMLQNIHMLSSNGAKFYIPPIEEIIDTEKRKLEDEKKQLEHQLEVEKVKKEEALNVMASQPEHPGASYLKQIESTRKKLEETRYNTQMNEGHVTMMNKTLANLKNLYYESNEALLAERNRLSEIEDKIKELRQQLRPLHIKAKAMQIDSVETTESTGAETSRSNLTSSLGSSSETLRSPTPAEYPLRSARLGGASTLRSHSLVRNPSRLTRVASEAHFLQSFAQGVSQSSDENRSPGRGNMKRHPNRYLLLADPHLPGNTLCMLLVNKTVWVGCHDGTIRMYDKDTARITAELTREPLSAVFCMEIVARDIWTGHKDGTIKIWTANGTFREVIEAHIGQVTSIVRVGPTNVWSIGQDKNINMWDFKSRRLVKKKATDAYMLCMCYDTVDTVWIAADSQIVRWDAKTLKKVNTLTRHTKLVHHLAVVQDTTSSSSPSTGKTMWSCSSDYTICIWDVTTAKMLTQINTRVKGLKILDFGPDVWCCTYNKSILRIDKRTHTITERYEDAHGDAITAMVSVPYEGLSSRVWTGSYDKCVCIWKSDNPLPRILTPKQKAILIANWRQLFNGTNGTILSENCDVEETSSALGVIGKLIFALEKNTAAPVG